MLCLSAGREGRKPTTASAAISMSNALPGSIGIVAYLALFAGVGFLFVFANLLIGRFLRPSDPHEEKLEIYECGEPAIGSSFVQFDLRFYVVALIFIVFDVEVAFLFPLATVLGKAHDLEKSTAAVVRVDGSPQLSPTARDMYKELGVRNPVLPAGTTVADGAAAVSAGGKELMLLATLEVLVFFVILILAFAYEWKLGALDWVRALVDEQSERGPPNDGSAPGPSSEPVLSA